MTPQTIHKLYWFGLGTLASSLWWLLVGYITH